MPEFVFDIAFEKIVNKKFLPLLKDQSNYLVLRGSANSGKSKFLAQKILFRMLFEEGHRFLLLRKVYATIRKSQFSDITDFIKSYGLGKYFRINKTDLTITCTLNGNECVAAGLDEREKLKSISNITGAWIEEVTELDLEDFLQTDLRLRGETRNYMQLMVSFNPIDENHWIREYFFPPESEPELDKSGYYKYKKEVEFEDGGKDYLSISLCHSTYLDNQFLGDKDKAKLNALKKTNYGYYLIYCLGRWGSIGNRIYPNGFVFTEKYPEEYDEVVYGLDFGFVHPTALIRVGIKNLDQEGELEIRKEFYVEELIYESGLHNKQLIEKMRSLNINPNDLIFADHQAADKIDELNEATDEDGNILFDVRKADKSVLDGIDEIKSSKIFTRSLNVGLNKEVVRYRYKLDKDGKPTEQPVKKYDDALDALRYAIYTISKLPDFKMAFI